MIRANLQRLVPPHHQPRLLILLVLQQSHVPRAALLPFPAVAVEFEKLRAHLEGLFLELLVGFGLDLLGQVDHGLEVHFGGFGCAVVLCHHHQLASFQ